MKLHEAIEQLIKQKGSMSANNVALELNRNKWYSKKDGSLIKSSQISARVKNYTLLFKKRDGIIYLVNEGVKQKKKVIIDVETVKAKIVKPILNGSFSISELMDENYFKLADLIDDNVPDEPGLYCIRIKNINSLNVVFANELLKRDHNIIYIGLASKSLKQRFLGQELRAKGHGTFFRSIGAVLGYTPEKGSLIGKKNQNNYKFSTTNQKNIIVWINSNLLVNWVVREQDLNIIENNLIKQYLPLLNGTGNPSHLQELKDLRAKCRLIARSK